MSIATLNFRIDFEWLTEHVRNLWAEGSFDNAIKTARAAFPEMSIESVNDVIRGNAKWQKCVDDEDCCTVEADDWKPDLDRCEFGKYPDPDDLVKMAERSNRLERQAEEEERIKADNIAREINRCTAGPDLQALMEIWEGFSAAARKGISIPTAPIEEPIKPSKPFVMPQMFGGYGSLDEMNKAMLFQREVPTAEQFMAIIDSRSERESKGKPKPDNTLSDKLGWILPNGAFYGCKTKMEHVWLADQIAGLTETAAEGKGWVKISRDIFTDKSVILKGQREPTQKQINTVFDWCEKHKQTLPDWAGGEKQ